MGPFVKNRGMWIRVGWAAACFAAIMGFSRLAYGVLVPAMRASLGGGFALYGAIGGANMVGYLAGSLLTTRLARRPDRSRVNAIALVTMCVAMAASGFVVEPIALGVLRLAVGVASGIALALTLALAVEHVPAERRGVAAAIVWGGGCLGIAIVGAASGLAATSSGAWRVEWIAMGVSRCGGDDDLRAPDRRNVSQPPSGATPAARSVSSLATAIVRSRCPTSRSASATSTS